jgi:Lrp/AsnC family transcriptional regulator, regulator for asnA, asnC and gidA
MEIDEVDKKIMNVLLSKPKLSVRDIAKHTDVSSVTVLKRIKNLEKEGVIKSYTTYLNYSKIGYDLDVIIKIRVSKGKLFEVEEKIAIHKNIFAVYDITGDFDVIVIAKFKNRKSLDAFLKKIQTYSFVERTETVMILNTIKEQFIGVE